MSRAIIIPGYSRYAARDDGTVVSLVGRLRGRVLHGANLKGYRHIKVIRDDGPSHKQLAHRLIALAFHGHPPAGLPYCCHRDGDTTNNHPDNLYWGDATANAADRKSHGREADRSGRKNGRARLTLADVAAIRANFTGKYGQVSQLARQYNIANSQMHEICHGKSW